LINYENVRAYIMKKIYLNLKRFDIPRCFGGVNDLGEKEEYAKKITSFIDSLNDFKYTIFFQESNLIPALKVAKNIYIGCQGVHYDDVEIGHNFGAFTTFRTAKSMTSIGVNDVIIGHCEERKHLNYLVSLGGNNGDINLILNEEIKRATSQKMNVLYCIGEKIEEQNNKYEILKKQILTGLKDVDLKYITIAYEPVWAIGPGKVPPNKEYIEDIVKYIKTIVCVDVVYGGGLKEDNAKMIASIKDLDGGLIALTRFGKDFGFYLDDFKKIIDTYKGGL